MEQYELDGRFRARDIPRIVKRFRPVQVFIRQIGSKGGKTMVKSDVRGKIVVITRVANALDISINGVTCFTYTQSPPRGRFEWGRRFSIAYERERYTPASSGFDDPYDPKYSPIKESVLRGANSDYLMEITFDGIIPVVKTKPWFPPIYYWRVDFHKA